MFLSPFFFFFFLDPAQDLRDDVSVVAPFLLFLDPVQDLRSEGCNDFSFPIFFWILCRNPEMRAAVAVNFPFFLDPVQHLRDEISVVAPFPFFWLLKPGMRAALVVPLCRSSLWDAGCQGCRAVFAQASL